MLFSMLLKRQHFENTLLQCFWNKTFYTEHMIIISLWSQHLLSLILYDIIYLTNIAVKGSSDNLLFWLFPLLNLNSTAKNKGPIKRSHKEWQIPTAIDRLHVKKYVSSQWTLCCGVLKVSSLTKEMHLLNPTFFILFFRRLCMFP